MTEEKNENTIIETAQNTTKELEILENPENRVKITEALKNSFISDRLETSSKQEKLRDTVLNVLMNKITNEKEKVPLMTLLKILEITNKGGEVDLSNVIGNKGGNGANIQINNNPNTISSDQALLLNQNGASHKELGFLLEGIKTIANNIPEDRTLELKKILKDDE